MIETRGLSVKSKEDIDIIDITGKVEKELGLSGMKEGVVTVFVNGSTASVSTMEFEPNLVKDVKKVMERLAPDGDYEHHKTWGDRNGKSHCRATLMGPSVTIPFKDGRLLLGRWQQLVLLDFDVPARERSLILTFIGD